MKLIKRFQLALAVVGICAFAACSDDKKSDDEDETLVEDPGVVSPGTQPTQTSGGGSLPPPKPKDDEVPDDGDDADSPAIADIEITASFPMPASLHVFAADTSVRTVTFTHNADSATCSRDGGVTFGSCAEFASGTAKQVWEADDYNAEHVVRFVKEGAANSPLSYAYTPSAKIPDLDLIACDTVVTENMNFPDFATAYLQTADKVVCIQSGVKISTSTAAMIPVQVPNITIVGDYDDDTVEFANEYAGGSTISDHSVLYVASDGFTLKGATITVAGELGAGVNLWSAADFLIEDSKFSGMGYGLNFETDGMDAPLSGTVNKVRIDMDDDFGNVAMNFRIADFDNKATINITNSTIYSGGYYGVYVAGKSVDLNIVESQIAAGQGLAIYTWLDVGGLLSISNSNIKSTDAVFNSSVVEIASVGDLNITQSTISGLCNGAAACNTVRTPVFVTVDASYAITDSILESAGGSAVNIPGSFGPVVNYELSGNIFKRLDVAGLSLAAIDATWNMVSGTLVNSADNGNLFCHVNPDNTWWTAFAGENENGTFVAANQLNGGAIVACP